MAILDIPLDDTFDTTSTAIKERCDELWELKVGQLSSYNAFNDAYSILRCDKNLFSHSDMRLKSPIFWADNIRVVKPDTIEQVADLFGPHEQSYFRQWDDKVTSLVAALKQSGSYTSDAKAAIKELKEALRQQEVLAKHQLLNLAYQQKEQALQIFAEEHGLKLEQAPEIKFNYDGSYSKKTVLEQVEALYRLQESRLNALSLQISARNQAQLRANDETKAGLDLTKSLPKFKAAVLDHEYKKYKEQNRQIEQAMGKLIGESHTLGKLWVDNKKGMARELSRPVISRLRRLAHGSLGVISFLSLTTLIAALLFATGPAAPFIIGVSALTGIGCMVLSVGYTVTEMIVNKTKYHQNPTKMQVAQLVLTAVLTVLTLGANAVGSTLVSAFNYTAKFFLGAKGAKNAAKEIKSVVSHDVHASSTAFVLKGTAAVEKDDSKSLSLDKVIQGSLKPIQPLVVLDNEPGYEMKSMDVDEVPDSSTPLEQLTNHYAQQESLGLGYKGDFVFFQAHKNYRDEVARAETNTM